MRKFAAFALGVVVLAGTTGASAAGAQTASGGTVTVLHGIPDLTVDVYVDDELTLNDFAPGTVTDPLSLPAGDHAIDIRGADDPADADPVLSGSASVSDGVNASVIANLAEDGEPTINVFANDTAPIAGGKARIVVRHTAAAPAVDVRADGNVAFADLTNPNEAKADLDAGTVSADVVLAGTDTVVLGPADLDLAAGTSTIVYAWGSAADENLDLMVQTISDLGAAPAPVPSDDELPSTGTSNTWLLTMLAASVLLTGGGALALARTRRDG